MLGMQDPEVDEEAQEILEEVQQRVSLLLPSLDVLGEKNEYAELQGVLKALIQHCSYTRIEKELLPEKEAAAEEKKTVIEENEVKQ